MQVTDSDSLNAPVECADDFKVVMDAVLAHYDRTSSGSVIMAAYVA